MEIINNSEDLDEIFDEKVNEVVEYKNYILVGRPNVGKSSIFNFLIGKHEAFVRDEDGTTVDWRSKKVGNIVLWDTPGVFKLDELPPCDKIDKIFFVVENNILEYDKKFYIELKKRFDVFVIVNKMDLEKNNNFQEEYRFFGDCAKISLKNRTGLNDLRDVFFEDYVNIEEPTKKIWAVIGKPNVGKSSLINLMAKKNVNKVADYEGTTKEFLPVDVDEKILLDTPGQRNRPLFPQYSDIFGIIVVLDLKQERQDLRLIGMAAERKRPIIVVINKIDLAKKDEVKIVEEKISRFWDLPIIKISCISKRGVDSIMDTIKNIEINYSKRIKTFTLNDWLRTDIRKIESRVKFITQIEVSPPKFFVDCRLETHKEKMLKRRLAKKFGFEGVHIELKYKE